MIITIMVIAALILPIAFPFNVYTAIMASMALWTYLTLASLQLHIYIIIQVTWTSKRVIAYFFLRKSGRTGGAMTHRYSNGAVVGFLAR